jgi:hypothetical protein
MNSINVKNKAYELIDNIKSKFITQSGLLARNYPVSNRTIFDNFDDIVPFFLYFGEEEFLLSQVRIIKKNNENILTLCAQQGTLVTRSIDEWFGGFYALWKKTGDQDTFRIISDSVRFVQDKLIDGDFLSAGYYISKKVRVPYYESWSSGILETFCEMREDFPDMFETSQKIMKKWLNDQYFQRYGLFPYRTHLSSFKQIIHKNVLSRLLPQRNSKPPSIDGRNFSDILKNPVKKFRFELTNGWYSQLMKSNSTCAFCLLEFYLATGNKFWLQNLARWIESVICNFCDEGKVYSEFFPEIGVKRDPAVTPAFIFADVICDVVAYLPEFKTFLPKVKEILDYHWKLRLENGLIPYHDGDNYAHIDSQVDFGVSLRRYAELTGENGYLNKSSDLTMLMLQQHYSSEGFFTFSGKIENNIIDPKYNALVLKGMINLLTIDQSIYPDNYSLFKDR